ANRDSAARNLGARPDLFGHSKRALKQSMQISAGSAGCARSLVRAFGLPKNLGFADHHGIEPGSDAKEMLRTSLVFVAIKWRREMMRITLAHETTHDRIRRYSSPGCGANFDA